MKSTMALLSCCRRNFEELAIVTQMLSAEGNGACCRGRGASVLVSFVWVTGDGAGGKGPVVIVWRSRMEQELALLRPRAE
jgi:hypothetical protein